MKHSMISTLRRHLATRTLLSGMAATIMLACCADDLLAQSRWKELAMPSMHLQAWGRPGIRGAIWVIPQDSGVVGVSHDRYQTVIHKRVDALKRRFTHAAVVDDNVAVVGGDAGVMFRTRDGGETWLPVMWSGPPVIGAMAATPRGTVIVVDRESRVYRSDDRGMTFMEQSTVLPSVIDHIVHSVTGDTLFAYGSRCVGILISTDDGATWVRSEKPTSGVPRDFNVCRDGSLVILDKDGLIWVRNSPTTSWKRPVPTFAAGPWYGVAYASKDTMIVVGRGNGGEMVLNKMIKAVQPWGEEYWNGQALTSHPEWFKDAQYLATDRGLLVIGKGTSVLVEYRELPLVISEPGVEQWTSTIGSTRSGFPLICGISTFQRQNDLGLWDSYIVWFAKYDSDTTVEREIVVNRGSGPSSSPGGSIGPSLERSEAGGTMRCYFSDSSTAMMYSDDDGRTWSVVPTVPGDTRLIGYKRVLKLGTDKWLMNYALVDGKGAGASMTLYISGDQGRTWDSVVIPISLPQQPRGGASFVQVQSVAPDRVFGNIYLMDDEDRVIPVDIDIERRTARLLTVRPRRGEWMIVQGRHLLNYYQIWNVGRTWATGYLETYDIPSDTKINELSMAVLPSCGIVPSSYTLGDSVAAVYGWCNRIFLTDDAGMTWREEALSNLDNLRIWNYGPICRLRPGVYLSTTMGGDTTGRYGAIYKTIVFYPDWDPVPVSVEAPVSSASQNTLTVSPNPSVGLVSVDVPEDMDGQYSWYVVDMLGRIVAEGTADTMTGRRITPGMSLPSGGYTFVLQSRTGRRTARFVVQP